MSATIIAIANQKGGVGKTTTTQNIGFALAARDLRVLMLDLDPQASLTQFSNIDPLEVTNGMVDLLRYDPDNVTKPYTPGIRNIVGSLDIIPTNMDLAVMPLELSQRVYPNDVLKSALNGEIDPIAGQYDYILFDCPPTLDRLTLNALVAADRLIIPCKTSYLDYAGVKLIMGTFKQVKRVNKNLELACLIPMMYQSRNTHDREVLAAMQADFGDLCRGFVPLRTEYQNASFNSRPVNDGLQIYWYNLASYLIDPTIEVISE